MERELTPAEAKRLRTQHGWSLQYLSSISGINKPYLSEFENGRRPLPQPILDSLKRLLNQEEPAGYGSPKIIRDKNHHRLIFVDPATGLEKYRPPIAHITWTEEDGTSYRMYLGEW